MGYTLLLPTLIKYHLEISFDFFSQSVPRIRRKNLAD